MSTPTLILLAFQFTKTSH